MQIRDLDKGTFGFVQLAVDLTTGEQVAIKFIERSQEVNCLTSHLGCALSRLREGVDGIQLWIAWHAFYCRDLEHEGPCRCPNMWSERSSITRGLYTHTLCSSRR